MASPRVPGKGGHHNVWSRFPHAIRTEAGSNLEGGGNREEEAEPGNYKVNDGVNDGANDGVNDGVNDGDEAEPRRQRVPWREPGNEQVGR